MIPSRTSGLHARARRGNNAPLPAPLPAGAAESAGTFAVLARCGANLTCINLGVSRVSADIPRTGSEPSPQPFVRQGLDGLAVTSPELAIKIAYDFGRNLRIEGAEVDELPELIAAHIDRPLADSVVRVYARAGFIAGFHFASLPWRREVDAGLT